MIGPIGPIRRLAAYLDRFRSEVQRFFPMPAGTPAAAFVPHAARYPAFEILPAD